MRRGFTLVELLLVLALLVVAAAIAGASISAGQDRTQLMRAAEQLQRTWAEARLQAIDEGRPLVFRCRIDSAQGFVLPSDAIDLTAVGPAADDDPASGEAAGPLLSIDLPGARFERLFVADPPGSPWVGAGVPDGEDSALIAFYPDGATSDAEAALVTETDRRIVVSLRGLTGGSRVSQVEPEPTQ